MNNLRALRKKTKKTQQQLADFLGITQQGYACYENETRIPPTDMTIKLADYFNVSVDYLLGRAKKDNEGSEWTDEERALGVGNHPTHLSDKEWEWLELRSEVIEKCGEAYLVTVVNMLQTLIETNKKK